MMKFKTNINQINVLAWNMRSLTYAKYYINDLIVKHDLDILCISEHRLYECDLYKLGEINPNYNYHGKASKDLESNNQSTKRGHCGVAILWKKCIGHCVKVVECVSDRICCIELLDMIYGKSIYIISVYLPQQGCKIADFQSELYVLNELIAVCSLNGEVIIMGDTNAHFGADVGDRF